MALTVAGALLRFGTLDVQELWLDEAVTAGLMRLGVADMVSALWTTESTPPLYYLVARAWTAVFGTGDVGLRSLSAVAGTLTIPVVYGIGATLASRRVGHVAAALAAVSPALVWYSQEARSYALAILLCALSLLFAARVRRGGEGRDLAWWALTSGLALATHYFAVFLVAGEAVWLFLAARNRRPVVLWTAVVAAIGAALLPMAIHQSNQGNLEFVGDTPLLTRLVDTAQLFVAGPTGDRIELGGAVLYAAALGAGALALLAAPPERRTALELAALGLGGAAAAVLVDLAGGDYVLARNLLPLFPPVAVALAIGIACARWAAAGAATGIVLALASLWLVLAVPLDRTLQREQITVQLLGLAQDVDRQRIDPRVAFATGDTGDAVAVRAGCDAGTTLETGGAVLRRGSDEAPAPVRESRQELSASAVAREDGSVLSLYVVCVGARD